MKRKSTKTPTAGGAGAPSHADPAITPDGNLLEALGIEASQAAAMREGLLYEQFVRLLCRDDGWLRIVSHDGGSTVYYKWKWTLGANAGYYVMVLWDAYNPLGALLLLGKKILDVELGKKRPILDRRYDGDRAH